MQEKEHEETGSSQNNICYLCNIEFTEKTEFVNHVITIHAKFVTNYRCDICDSSFSCKKKLKRHIFTLHESLKDKKCDTCNKKFFTKEAYKVIFH